MTQSRATHQNILLLLYLNCHELILLNLRYVGLTETKIKKQGFFFTTLLQPFLWRSPGPEALIWTGWRRASENYTKLSFCILGVFACMPVIQKDNWRGGNKSLNIVMFRQNCESGDQGGQCRRREPVRNPQGVVMKRKVLEHSEPRKQKVPSAGGNEIVTPCFVFLAQSFLICKGSLCDQENNVN